MVVAKQFGKRACNTVASSQVIADSMPGRTRKQLCNQRLLTASVWDLRAVCGPPSSAVLDSPMMTSKVPTCNKNLYRRISGFDALKHRAWMVIMAPAPHRSSQHWDHLQRLQSKRLSAFKSTTSLLLSHKDLESTSGRISLFLKMYNVKEPWHTRQYQIVSVYAFANFLRPIAHCLILSYYSKSHSAQSNQDWAKLCQKNPNEAMCAMEKYDKTFNTFNTFNTQLL